MVWNHLNVLKGTPYKIFNSRFPRDRSLDKCYKEFLIKQRNKQQTSATKPWQIHGKFIARISQNLSSLVNLLPGRPKICCGQTNWGVGATKAVSSGSSRVVSWSFQGVNQVLVQCADVPSCYIDVEQCTWLIKAVMVSQGLYGVSGLSRTDVVQHGDPKCNQVLVSQALQEVSGEPNFPHSFIYLPHGGSVLQWDIKQLSVISL